MTAGSTPALVGGPLPELERRVQAQAKEAALDLATDSGAARLRELVGDEIRAWNDDFRRGRVAVEIADPATAADRAWRNLTGYGPLAPLLDDPDVWEISVNAPDQIFVRRHRGLSGWCDEQFHDDDHVVRTLTKILDDAQGAHRKLDPSEGLQDAQLRNGARLHIVHGDVSRGGHTMVSIRKFGGVPVSDLDELVERDMLSPGAAGFLRAAVAARLTIVFAGAPGAGKTTLLSCATAELDRSLRVVVAEEVFELDVQVDNVASMQTRPARTDRPEIDLRRLVAGFLRMAPDVAVVGEVRDREALPLLLTLSSGVTGYTTIHAGSARQALTRLRFICQLSDAADLPLSALNTLVSESIDLVVHCARQNGRVEVTEILAVEDLAGAADATTFTSTSLYRRAAPGEPLRATGERPARAARALAAAGFQVARLLDDDLAPPVSRRRSRTAPAAGPEPVRRRPRAFALNAQRVDTVTVDR